MSKRSKKKVIGVTPTTPAAVTAAPPSQAHAAPSPAMASGTEVLRRMLLAVLTLVLVARPFVWGEDAGMVSELADPSGMVLTFLTFAACAGWAVWRLMAHQGGVHVGAVEIGLFLLAVLFLIGATVAPYTRAAWFTGAEWLGLVMLLFLTRQLSTRPEEQHGIMTALLATMVALCAQGVFQAAYQTPRLARQADTPRLSVAHLNRLRGVSLTPLEIHQLTQQLEKRLVTGPFFRPVSLAACLVLLLPLACGAMVACVRSKAPPLLTGPIGLCVLLAAVVLGLTRVAPAIATLAAAGLLWVGVCWPKRLGGWTVGLIVGLGAAGGLIFLMHTRGLFADDVERWREVWPTAYRVGDSRFWTGVGGGHFSFYYPRFISAEGGYRVSEPSSSLLEVFCEAGFLGVVALLVPLVLLIRTTARWWLASTPAEPPAAAAAPPVPAPQPPSPPPSESGMEGVRWEFYLGGMLATILAFTLRAQSLSPAELTGEAFAAGIRSVTWFLAFALFERVSWTPREYAGSLIVGVGGLLVLSAVAPVLTFPGVAALLWVAVGLLLAVTRPAPAAWLPTRRFAQLFLPALVCAALVHLALVVFPASIGTFSVREAKRQAAVYYSDRQAAEQKIADPDAFIEREILERLEAAERDDPGNVRIQALLGDWKIRRWRIGQGQTKPEQNKEAKAAVASARQARGTNPEAPDGYEAEYHVYYKMGGSFVVLAKQIENDLENDKKETKSDKKMPAEFKKRTEEKLVWCHQRASEAFGFGAKAAADFAPRDPTNPSLLYMIADSLDLAAEHQKKAADDEDKKELARLARDKAKEAATEALKIDRAIGEGRPRSLSDQQRTQLNEILRR